MFTEDTVTGLDEERGFPSFQREFSLFTLKRVKPREGVLRIGIWALRRKTSRSDVGVSDPASSFMN